MSSWQRAQLSLPRKNSSGMSPPCSVFAALGKKRPLGASHDLARHFEGRGRGVQRRRRAGREAPNEPSGGDRPRRRAAARGGSGARRAGRRRPRPRRGGPRAALSSPGRSEQREEQAGNAERAGGGDQGDPDALAPKLAIETSGAQREEPGGRRAEQRMQQDLRGVEERGPPGGDEVSRVEQQEPAAEREQAPVSHRSDARLRPPAEGTVAGARGG